jgi:hypothetical protein
MCRGTSAPRHRPGGQTVGAYLGTSLRHSRRAAELNLRAGPSAAVAESAKRARDALDSALWLCDYVCAEGDQ